MYTNIPILSEKDSQDAQILSSKLYDAASRKRAYVDFTGAFFLLKELGELGLRANSARSIFKFPKLYSDFEIVDIYCNSHMLYVLTAYGTGSVKIPVFHKEYNILPEAYVVIDLKVGMSSAEIKGVILPSDIDSARSDGKYYRFDINKLQSFEDFTGRLKKYVGLRASVGRHWDCMNLFIPYIEGSLKEQEKIAMIGHILTCETCKKRLTDAIEFNEKIKTIGAHKDILPPEILVAEDVFLRSLKEKNTNTGSQLNGAIDAIYKDEKMDTLKADVFKFRPEFPKKIQNLILITGTFVLVLFVLVIFAFNIPKNAEKAEQQTAATAGDVLNSSQDVSDNFDISAPQINKNKGYATVSKVSWEVPSEITADEQKTFLQTAGKSIRLNLQNDLLLSSETAVGERVKFDIKFLRDGSLDEISVNETSGSGAVDQIIKQSIQNTLKFMRPPKGSFMGKKNAITLVIEF